MCVGCAVVSDSYFQYIQFLIVVTICYVHPVSNMVSYSTRHTLTVPHIFECWTEDGLIGLKHVATIKYQYLYTVVVLWR